MIRALKTFVLIALMNLFLAPWAHAAELNAEYLTGRWVLDAQDCNSKDAETIEFRKNGTYECLRAGEAESVGFWRIDKDLLELNMVTSPAFYSDIDPRLKAYKNLYNYFQTKMLLFNVEKDSFGAVGVLGNEVKRTQAVKCR